MKDIIYVGVCMIGSFTFFLRYSYFVIKSPFVTIANYKSLFAMELYNIARKFA